MTRIADIADINLGVSGEDVMSSSAEQALTSHAGAEAVVTVVSAAGKVTKESAWAQ